MMFMIVQTTVMAHHYAMNPEEHDTMQPPPPLETILEGIESSPAPSVKNENNDLVITDNDTSETEQQLPEIKPVALGELL